MAELSIDPKKDVKKIAVIAINKIAKDSLKMADSTLGDLVAPVLSEELVNLFGLGSSSPDYTSYLQNIQDGIAAIEGDLEALQAAVAQIQQVLGEVLQTVRRIEEEVIESELQGVLRSFLDRSAVIHESFESFVDAATALSSAEADDRRQAAEDLFQLFDLASLEAVAVAMTQLRNLVNPDLAEATGLQELQLEKLGAVIAATVPDDGNYRTWWAFHMVAWGADLYAKLDLAVQSELGYAANAFKAFVLTELQGLILLTCGWGNTIQAPRVAEHVDGVNAALARIAEFEKEALQGTDSFAGIEPLYRHKLSALATPAPDVGGNFRFWSENLPGMNGSTQRGVFRDWLAWSTIDGETFTLALPVWTAWEPRDEHKLAGHRFIWAGGKDSRAEPADPAGLPEFVLTGSYPLPDSLTFIRNFAADPP